MDRHHLTVGDVASVIECAFPLDKAAEWDRNGLLVGDASVTVTGIALALDASVSAVRMAAKAGANVLLTHHPVFLEPLGEVTPQGSASSAAAFQAAASGVALICAHTNLDASSAARETLGSTLALGAGCALDSVTGNPDHRFGYLWELTETVTLDVLVERAAALYGNGILAWGDPGTTVKTAVSGTGSGGSLVEAALAVGADVLVTGEAKYHSATESVERGLAVIELGHGTSEWPLVQILHDAVSCTATEADVPVIVLDPPLTAWTAKKGSN